MRASPTPAEDRLWQRLRRRALGVRFRRQHVIEAFVVDFCALEAMLVVELDGPIHRGQTARDAERDAVLAGAGYRVLRFSNNEVENRLEEVLEKIQTALAVATSPSARR